MRKFGVFFCLLFFAFSCDKEYISAEGSSDKALIMKAADKYYEKKDWGKALILYEKLPSLVFGTEDAPKVLFRTAYANYYDKNYRLAGHLFKDFSNAYPRDSRAEETSYMSAFCYYKASPDYNLDQSATLKAIDALQNFLDLYPGSDRVKDVNQFMEELSHKLERKAFESAFYYYKIAEYKSADIAFENLLNDFPSTEFRVKAHEYILRSRRNLAFLSVHELKMDRIDHAISFAKQAIRDFPGTSFAREAEAVIAEMQLEKKRFLLQEQETKAQKQQVDKKEKVKPGESESPEGEQRGSADPDKPSPSANFRIRRG